MLPIFYKNRSNFKGKSQEPLCPKVVKKKQTINKDVLSRYA